MSRAGRWVIDTPKTGGPPDPASHCASPIPNKRNANDSGSARCDGEMMSFRARLAKAGPSAAWQPGRPVQKSADLPMNWRKQIHCNETFLRAEI